MGGTNGDDVPAGYLNYLVFDDDMNYLKGGFASVSSATSFNQELMSLPNIDIDDNGYIYIYVSNESNSLNYVYFDDLKVTHTPSPIIQTDDYYPFGLTMNSYQRTGSRANDFLYNGKEKNEETGWYDYGARMYDAAIGRWHVPDPLADVLSGITPYRYALNNPIRYVDNNGKFESDPDLPGVWFIQADFRIVIPIAGPIGLTGSYSIGIATDWDGNYALYQTVSFGPSSGAGGSAGFVGGYNFTVNNVDELSGWSINPGTFLTPQLAGFNFGGEVNVPIKTENGIPVIENINDLNIGISLTIPGLNVGSGGAVYLDLSYTELLKTGNIKDILNSFVDKLNQLKPEFKATEEFKNELLKSLNKKSDDAKKKRDNKAKKSNGKSSLNGRLSPDDPRYKGSFDESLDWIKNVGKNNN